MPLTVLGRRVVVYALLGLEFGAAGVCYYYWHNMNVSQDYREEMQKRHPKVLEWFYRSCDLTGYTAVREYDRRAWERKRLESTSTVSESSTKGNL
jgi:hypothetical protein